MRRPESSNAVVLGVPRVRAARPVAQQIADQRSVANHEIEISVDVEMPSEPIRMPLRAASPRSGLGPVYLPKSAPAIAPSPAPSPAPASVRISSSPVRPSTARRMSAPTMRVSASPSRAHLSTPLSAFALTPADGVALPPRGADQGDAIAWLARAARSIPTRVAEHLVTFGVAMFSFAFLAAVIATFGGSDVLPQRAAAAAQEPRAGYTRPFVEKLATGAMPQAESGPMAATQPLQMMQVKSSSRTTRGAAPFAVATAEAVRRAPAPAPVTVDIPMEREPVRALVAAAAPPVAAPPVAAPPIAAPPAAPAAKPPTAIRPSTPRTTAPPSEPRAQKDPSESGLAQRALDDARHEDTSLGGH